MGDGMKQKEPEEKVSEKIKVIKLQAVPKAIPDARINEICKDVWGDKYDDGKFESFKALLENDYLKNQRARAENEENWIKGVAEVYNKLILEKRLEKGGKTTDVEKYEKADLSTYANNLLAFCTFWDWLEYGDERNKKPPYTLLQEDMEKFKKMEKCKKVKALMEDPETRSQLLVFIYNAGEGGLWKKSETGGDMFSSTKGDLVEWFNDAAEGYYKKLTNSSWIEEGWNVGKPVGFRGKEWTNFVEYFKTTKEYLKEKLKDENGEVNLWKLVDDYHWDAKLVAVLLAKEKMSVCGLTALDAVALTFTLQRNYKGRYVTDEEGKLVINKETGESITKPELAKAREDIESIIKKKEQVEGNKLANLLSSLRVDPRSKRIETDSIPAAAVHNADEILGAFAESKEGARRVFGDWVFDAQAGFHWSETPKFASGLRRVPVIFLPLFEVTEIVGKKIRGVYAYLEKPAVVKVETIQGTTNAKITGYVYNNKARDLPSFKDYLLRTEGIKIGFYAVTEDNGNYYLRLIDMSDKNYIRRKAYRIEKDGSLMRLTKGLEDDKKIPGNFVVERDKKGNLILKNQEEAFASLPDDAKGTFYTDKNGEVKFVEELRGVLSYNPFIIDVPKEEEVK
jgi:hypothetical protein